MRSGPSRMAPPVQTTETPAFTAAIVRRVPDTMGAGITSADLGEPDLEVARTQHDRYVRALRECGLDVTVLDADARHPDSVFVEDPAVVTDRCAIATNPGAESRKGEVREIEATLSAIYGAVERIVGPGTLDGGDVLQTGDHFYVGLTRRTNREGAGQLEEILRSHGFGVSLVALRRFLHLKTGVAYLGGNDLVVAGELVENPAFDAFDKIVAPPEEEYAANCVRVNDRVLVAAGNEKTRDQILARGYDVIELEMSEFRKLDGGLSCLSLRCAALPRVGNRGSRVGGSSTTLVSRSEGSERSATPGPREPRTDGSDPS